MTLTINNQPVIIPDEITTIKDLVVLKNINPQGTAIALNDKLVRQDLWGITSLKDLDQVTIISAAFGG
ncbi:MAG: sulfur carrier protein ThiS [Muribaculaceae bacterium]|nr:sulfur carrier protein ThiS [Muribaculaceae bacterium]